MHTATEKVIRTSLGSHLRNDHKEIRRLPYVYHALHTFRKVFTRHSTWRRCARLSWGGSDGWGLFIVSLLAPRNPGLFGLTPSLSLLGIEPDGVALVLGHLCLESATNRDG